MAENSKIEWTDATWNPVVGCQKISEGCRNCYAKTLHDQRHAAYHAGKRVPLQYAKPFEEVQLMPDRLTDPLSWRKPKKIFVNSVSDLFHKDVPFEFIDRILATVVAAKRHTFQILTKRADRMAEYFADEKRVRADVAAWFKGNLIHKAVDLKPWLNAWPIPNLWLGVSVENQQAADERIPHLLRVPAAVRFLSCEPLLGPVDLTRIPVPTFKGVRFDSLLKRGKGAWGTGDRIDWVIVGGESGHGARPMHPDWARSLRDQCQAAGVPFFFKQHGDWADYFHVRDELKLSIPNGSMNTWATIGPDARCDYGTLDAQRLDRGFRPILRVGKKAAGRLLDGRTWDEFPAVGR